MSTSGIPATTGQPVYPTTATYQGVALREGFSALKDGMVRSIFQPDTCVSKGEIRVGVRNSNGTWTTQHVKDDGAGKLTLQQIEASENSGPPFYDDINHFMNSETQLNTTQQKSKSGKLQRYFDWALEWRPKAQQLYLTPPQICMRCFDLTITREDCYFIGCVFLAIICTALVMAILYGIPCPIN